MNIAVIGSGATAFGVLLKLKEKLGKSDIKITILSKDLNFMNKIFENGLIPALLNSQHAGAFPY